MQSPELVVILLNISILAFSYFWLYPKVAGVSLHKLALYDILSSVVSLIISGMLFWDSHIEFDALFDTLNWFWFTLLTYVTLEIPFSLWYGNRNRLW